ncbi:MAG: hypothetical protein ABEJ81_03935 [Haloferacaceae archaeon]
MIDPPPIDPDRLAGWRRTETSVETVLDLGWVAVTTATVVYEDPGLRERVREATRIDRTWRFFFATRLDAPGPSGSGALRRLVTAGATAGFVERLEARGFADVTEAGRRRFHVGESEAHAVRYEAVRRVDGVVVEVDGWIAVWPDVADGFLLAGGAYPTGVRSATGDLPGLSALFDPEAFRADLFALIRATG